MSEGYQPQTPQSGTGTPGQATSAPQPAQPAPGHPAPQPQSAPAPTPQPTPQPAPGQPTSQPQPTPAPQIPVIESASATTSPDNHSGPGAYVILAIGLALIIASSLVLANTFGEVLSEVADIVAEEYPDEEWDFDDDTHGTDADLTTDNIFETRISCADESVNSYVYASDYNGSQQAVSEFVSALTKADGDSTNLLSTHLRAAMGATDATTRTEELDAAAQVVADAQTSIQAIELPGTDRVSGLKADSVIDALGDAKQDCAERWSAIAKLVGILRSPDGHTTDELAELDEEASNIVDIAIRLTTALTDSASYK